MLNITEQILNELPEWLRHLLSENKSFQAYSTENGYAWIDFSHMGQNYKRFKTKTALLSSIFNYYE